VRTEFGRVNRSAKPLMPSRHKTSPTACLHAAAMPAALIGAAKAAATSAVAGQMLQRRRVELSWSEVASWSLRPETPRLIARLSQSEELLRLRGPSTDLRLLFRHDRVRDWLLVEAGASMDDENRLADEIVAEPYFSEILGAVIVRRGAPATLLERARRLNPLALFAEQISHAETAFETSPTLGLLLAVEALKLSRNNQLLECSKQLCVEFAADKLVTMLSKTGGTPLIGSSGPISDVSFSPDGKLLATADDQAVYLWRRDQLKSPLAKLKLPYSGEGTAVSFSPDGRLLATAAFGAVLLWRIDEPQQPFYTFPPIEFSNMGYTSASFSSNGKLVLTASGGGVRIWQLDQLKPGAKPIAELPAYVPSGRIIAASFISDDESIVTASDAGKVLQWRLDRLDKPVQLADLKMRLETASFGRDGKTVVIPRQLDTLDRENAAHFVNMSEASTWEDKPPLVNKQFYARAVTLSVDDKLVAAADDSGLVRVWGIDGETKAPEGLRGHQGPVYAASFSRDGKFILTGGADKSARLWHVDRRRAIAPADQSQNWTTRLEELIQLAGKTAGRNLTTEEWSNSFPDADYQPTFKDLPTPATDKQD
jgi:WD40 repeat protein